MQTTVMPGKKSLAVYGGHRRAGKKRGATASRTMPRMHLISFRETTVNAANLVLVVLIRPFAHNSIGHWLPFAERGESGCQDGS